MNTTVAYRNTYGTHESNGLTNGIAYHEANAANHHHDYESVSWDHPGLRVTRLRLVSDPGYPFWDVSYCDGELDGKFVRVELPFSELPKRAVAKTIIEHARRDKVYAKRLGILDCISTLN